MSHTTPPNRCITAPWDPCPGLHTLDGLEEEELAEREEEILTTGEAAALCGVSRSTLRRAVAQGHLRAWHTPGKHLRFTRAACLEFAQSLGRVDLIGQSYREAPVAGQPAQAGAVGA
jgi:excisionase family DNA binding protein